jgi:hypothetical protein|tara:strand:- start:2392 stop:2811 length:420 start_codon:yes stop_codon:yes gene_type:complete
MPIKNVEPEMAFTVIVNSPKHYGIFHAYEDDQWDKRCDFVYSTDILERRDFDFDISDVLDALRESLGDKEMLRILPYGLGTCIEEHRAIMQHAVSNGVVTFVADLQGVEDEPWSVLINDEPQDRWSRSVKNRKTYYVAE